MRALEDVVAALLAGDDAAQVRTIVGERRAGSIAEQLRALVRRSLAAEVTDCSYDHVSVGITLELRLDDGRRCVLKACRDGSEDPREALRVQAHLAAQGFPAPAVLAPPQPCVGAQVYLVEAIDRGESVRYDAQIRDMMAREYARLVTLAQGIDPRPALVDRTPQGDRLWPTPHSVLFDFEATRDGATPIDALASAAQARLQQRRQAPVIAHCDWSLQNVSIREGRLVGVFDWDSVYLVPELFAVAGAAVFHAHDWRIGPDEAAHDFYPGPEPALAFAEVYARARGLRWDDDDRATLHAALVYCLGYQARCEHALEPDEVGPAQRRLMRFAEAFGLAASPG